MISRRRFIRSSALSSTALLASWQSGLQASVKDPKVIERFPHGVASGDPTHNSVVIWSRVNPLSGDKNSGRTIRVKWEVSTSPDFNSLTQSGHLSTDSAKDFSIKIEVNHLTPSAQYFYRFIADDVTSETGRTRTLPTGSLDKLTIAIASCSNYPFGYFNAYEVIAADSEIDFVLHLGDYIYEYGADGYGGAVGDTINRRHQPAHETLTLDDYRQRHAQYKSDVASRMMHAAHPLIPTWDDHESANNPYIEGAQNHQDNEGDWKTRREASLQAYFEWMPIRDPLNNHDRKKLWRHFQFGDLASLVTLETRHTGRGVQVDYSEHLPAINNDKDLSEFKDRVLNDKRRTMLSDEMNHFLAKALATASKSRWQLIGNQIPMAKTHVPDLTEFLNWEELQTEGNPIAEELSQMKKLGDLDLPLYTDTWDGYPMAREAFYKLCRDQKRNDLLVLTGDSHSFWLNELATQNGIPMGFELGTAGITSPGDFEGLGEQLAADVDQLLMGHNRQVLWTHGRARGFIKLTLTQEKAIADYITVSHILDRRFDTNRLKRVEFAHVDDRIQITDNR